VESAVNVRRVQPVVRDGEAVAAGAHLPSRRRLARRADDAVVLESANRHACCRVLLDVEVVEQRRLKPASIERREGRAAGAFEEPSAMPAMGDGEGPGPRRNRHACVSAWSPLKATKLLPASRDLAWNWLPK